MPAERHDGSGRPIRGREDSSWLRAIAPLYRPAVRVETTGGKAEWQSRRSSEMIYRSWWSLQACYEQGLPAAKALRDTWLGEFQQICDGRQGRARKNAALALRTSFLTLPPGEFFMGSRSDRPRQQNELREMLEQMLADAPPNGHAEFVTAMLDSLPFYGSAGQRQKAELFQSLMSVLVAGSADIADSFNTDETPRSNPQVIGGFQLSRQPVSNGWVRLYATGHGLAPAEYHSAYKGFSPSGKHPAIFVSWYDAWAMATWCHWDGLSCRLPYENEWEYAAKFGQADPWQNYWWGEEYEKSRCNGRNDEGTTTVPDPAHASEATQALDREQHQKSLGLMDLLGNVLEWTGDRYRSVYERDDDDLSICQPAVSRVLRGGAFDSDADNCRSAYRSHGHPADTNNNDGVRLARAE